MAKGVVRNSELLTFLPCYAALREMANGELCAVPLQERDLAQTSISLITPPSRHPSPARRKLLETFKAARQAVTDAVDVERRDFHAAWTQFPSLVLFSCATGF